MASGKEQWARGILVGLLFLFLTHLLVWLAVKLLNTLLPSLYSLGLYLFLLYRVWLWQFVYAIPAMIWAGERGHKWVVNGIAIGVVVTIVINVLLGLFLGWKIGIGRTF